MYLKESGESEIPVADGPLTPQVPSGVVGKSPTLRPRTATSAAVRARTQSIPGLETMIDPDEDVRTMLAPIRCITQFWELRMTK